MLIASAAALAGLLGSAANSVFGSLITLQNGNSSFSVNSYNDNAALQDGAYNWTVDGINQLKQQWFWFRIGNSGPGIRLNDPTVMAAPTTTLIDTDGDGKFDYASLTYQAKSGAFKVVCSRSGDCLARYLVRMEEMLESLKIIEAAVENLPAGPVNVDVDSKVVLPNQLAVYRSIEGLIQHFELIMTNRQWRPPVDEVYGAIESPNGELGFYVVSDGSGRAYRARTRPPSFIHFAMFPYLMVGHQLSDVVAVLGSLNIIAAELDR